MTILGLIATVVMVEAKSRTPQEAFDAMCEALELEKFYLVAEPEIEEGSWMVDSEGHA